MGKKDASVTGLPLDQYRKQIGESLFVLVLVNQFVDCSNLWRFSITWMVFH